MGCGEISKQEDPGTQNNKNFHTLVGLMLSAQTKDEVTHSTTRFLIEEKNLSIPMILETPESDLNEWISRVGYHNKKAKYIK